MQLLEVSGAVRLIYTSLGVEGLQMSISLAVQCQLRGGRSGNWILVWSRFSTPVQTGPGTHPSAYTRGTVSFPEVKRPGRGIDHPPTSIDKVKERIELYLQFSFGPSWLVLGWPLPLPYIEVSLIREEVMLESAGFCRLVRQRWFTESSAQIA